MAVACNRFFHGVVLYDAITGRRPLAYDVNLRNCWIAYVEQEIIGLYSSRIIAIDTDTGQVLYCGSAYVFVFGRTRDQTENL